MKNFIFCAVNLGTQALSKFITKKLFKKPAKNRALAFMMILKVGRSATQFL